MDAAVFLYPSCYWPRARSRVQRNSQAVFASTAEPANMAKGADRQMTRRFRPAADRRGPVSVRATCRNDSVATQQRNMTMKKMRVVFTTVGQDCCPIGASEGNPVKKALVRPETDGRTRAFPLCEIVMKLNPDYFFSDKRDIHQNLKSMMAETPTPCTRFRLVTSVVAT